MPTATSETTHAARRNATAAGVPDLLLSSYADDAASGWCDGVHVYCDTAAEATVASTPATVAAATPPLPAPFPFSWFQRPSPQPSPPPPTPQPLHDVVMRHTPSSSSYHAAASLLPYNEALEPHGLPIAQLPVSRLRQIISSSGLSHADCLEISDMRARASEATELLLARRRARRLGGGRESAGKGVREPDADELVCHEVDRAAASAAGAESASVPPAAPAPSPQERCHPDSAC